MFADFVATSKIFRATGGIAGTYLNLYDYKTYLAQLSPDVPQRIASGYKGLQTSVNIDNNFEGVSTTDTSDNTSEPIIEFTANNYVFFEQIPPEHFKGAADRVIKEMKEIAKKRCTRTR